MSFIVWLARFTQPNYLQLSKELKRPILLTIQYSHFVEFARWSLQFKGCDFKEEWFKPGAHILPLTALRLGGETKHLSSTSRISLATAVPALVLPGGLVLSDSWAIAEYAGVGPAMPREIQRIYDEELGPLSRQLAYIHLLRERNRMLWDELLLRDTGIFWGFIYWLFFGNKLVLLMRKTFKVGQVDEELKCDEMLRALFKRIESERLAKRTGDYLGGDSLGVEDLALAALGAPLVLPPKYMRGEYADVFSSMIAQDSLAAESVNYYRNTVVGKYILDVYEKHR
jgi:glutathione S-transferase